jgi:hypothetical protein
MDECLYCGNSLMPSATTCVFCKTPKGGLPGVEYGVIRWKKVGERLRQDVAVF